MTRLHRLAALAALLRDRDLTHVRQAADACRTSETRLHSLTRTVPLAEDPALLRARQAHLAWAQGQHARLKQTLALQHATLAQARATASRSLARAEVLNALARVRK